jgi:sugar lactone lactonase YvrE
MRAPANSRTLVVILAALTTVALSACSNSNSTAATNYTIGGQLTGLASGRTVTLQNNSTDSLTLSASGSFTFATALAAGVSYSVTVSAQPSGQSCSVSSGSGTSLANNVMVVSVSCTNNANGLLSLLAGSPYGAGSLDGTGAAASFSYPIGVAADSSGNVYVADTDNNMIREITPAGVVTTLAGSASSSGGADGTGSGASFHRPLGLAVDSAGTVYVADTGNNTIRKVTSAGVVTTLAGTAGAVGSADGTGTAASFNLPTGLAVDGAGNVYVADSMNGTIRKITSAGVVTTLAGTAGVIGSADGTGTSASFNYPFGLAVDGAGNVYVADTYNDTIRVVTSAGVVTTLAGTARVTGSANGTGAAASFRQPFGLAVDGAGNLYVADTGNNTIRQITAAGVVTTLAGTAGATGGADGPGAAAAFYEPFGVAVDSAGNAYVADSSNNTIRKITPAAAVSTLAGAVPVSGNADGTGASATFSSANGLAADTAGNLYVADTGNNTIRKVTPAGVVTTLAGVPGSAGSADGPGATARFASPSGIAVDGAGNLYVADTGNNTIRKVTPAGVVTTLAGVPGSAGSADGAGAQTRFRGPAGIAADSAGNVYVADSGNNTIRKISPDGMVNTLAGTAGLRGSYDGTGAAAIFNGPTGMAVDSAGNVYVADTFNDTVREISPAGAVTTLAGTAGQIGSDDGTGSVASFNNPSGVAVDSSGNLYVADHANDTIRMITSAGVVTTVVGSAGKTGFLPGSAPGVIGSPRGIAVSGNAVSFTFAYAIGVLTVQ